MVRSHLAAEVLVMYSRMVGLRTGELRLSLAPIALRAYGLRSGQASLAALNFTDTVWGELEGPGPKSFRLHDQVTTQDSCCLP